MTPDAREPRGITWAQAFHDTVILALLVGALVFVGYCSNVDHQSKRDHEYRMKGCEES